MTAGRNNVAAAIEAWRALSEADREEALLWNSLVHPEVEALLRAAAEPEAKADTRWRQCGRYNDLPHECLGDATHGQYDSGARVCANFVVEHRRQHPLVAHTWRAFDRVEDKS